MSATLMLEINEDRDGLKVHLTLSPTKDATFKEQQRMCEFLLNPLEFMEIYQTENSYEETKETIV